MIPGVPTPDPARMSASLAPFALDPAGFRATPPRFHGPAVLQALASFRRPTMSSDVRFALVREPLKPTSKPVAMADLRALAKAIHDARDGLAIQLQDAPLNVHGWGELPGVSITTLDAGTGDARDYIGWAWLDGGSRASLEAALRARHATAPTIGRAA